MPAPIYNSQARNQQVSRATPRGPTAKPGSRATTQENDRVTSRQKPLPVRTIPSLSTNSALSSPRMGSALPYVPTKMSKEQVMEVIAIIGRSFPHFQCAVTGLSAMTYHGFRKRSPREVSLTFPSRYHDVVRGWALSQGFCAVEGRPMLFGVRLEDGRTCHIKTRFVDNDIFSTLRTVKAAVSAGPVRVLNLQTIAVHTARGYIAELCTSDFGKQSVFAGDMRWALGSLSRSKQVLRPFYARQIAQPKFWIPFTLSFPDTLPLFASVGLGCDEADALQSELQHEAESDCSLASLSSPSCTPPLSDSAYSPRSAASEV